MSDISESITGFFTRKTKASPPPRPVLSNALRFPYGQFQFRFQLAKGAAYEIQTTRDLQNWDPLSSHKAESAETEFLDAAAEKFNVRFYRVVSETVVSANVIGYVSISLSPGFSLISNPLNAPNNTVEKLFPNLPEGTTLHKFDTMLFRLNENTITRGKWSKPFETLAPGEGAIVPNPTPDPKKLDFVGEVLQGDLSLTLPAGFSIRSSMLPLSGPLHPDLQFPIAEGDAVHLFDREAQKYVIYSYQAGQWTPDVPVIRVAESFWVGKTSPGTWIRNVVLNSGA